MRFITTMKMTSMMKGGRRFYRSLDLNKLFVKQSTLILKINYILINKIKTLIQVYKSVLNLLFTKVILIISETNFHASIAIKLGTYLKYLFFLII